MSSLVPRRSLRSTALAALSAVAAFGAVTAPAHAEFKKQLNFACTYPILKGAQPLSLAITAQIPDTYPINTFTPAFAIHADATASGKTNQAIDLIGASSISGESVATSHLTAPGTDLDLDVPISIAKQAVDSSQTNILLAADGSTPPIKFKQAGTLLITVQGITLQLTGYDDQGNILTGIPNAPGSEDDGVANTFGVACVLSPADQDTLLATTTLTNGIPQTTPHNDVTVPASTTPFIPTTPVRVTTPPGRTTPCLGTSPAVVIPGDPSVTEVTSTSAKIAWNAATLPDTNGCFSTPTITGYTIQVGDLPAQIVSADTRNISVAGLTPNTAYDVNVTPLANAPVGTSRTTFKTLESTVTTPSVCSATVPGTPSVSETTLNSAKLTWQAAKVICAPGPLVTGYQIYNNGTQLLATVGAGSTTTTLTGLSGGVVYHVTVVPIFSGTKVASGSLQFVIQDLPTTPTRTTPVNPTTPVGPTTVDPNDIIDYGYSLAGSATLKNLVKGALPLKGTIAAHLNINDGSFNAELGLNQTTGNLTALGFLPVTATVQLVPTAPVTGSLVNKVLNATAKVRIKLPSIKTFGIQLAGGANCQATQISTIPLKSTAAFLPTQGGTIAGTFSISNLSGCGVLNGIVSPLTSGSGNAISLALTPSN